MATHYPGTAEERRALDVYIKVSRAAESLSGRINHHLKDYNLTLSQFGVLEAIHYLGPMRQNALARKILKSEGNMTLVIDNLVRRGLVTRERETADRRSIAVSLTEEGRQLVERIFPDHVQKVVAAVSVLTTAEQEQLGELCRKVGLGVIKDDGKA
jgi:MarR family transcriptional regulator, 2-MHQ and catechol-resistance regulon repressor